MAASGPAPARRPRHAAEGGGISWVTAVLIAAVAAGAYLAWTWAPVYLDHFTVKQVVRDFMNRAVKDRDDEGLRRDMVQKIRSIETLEVADDQGRTLRVPAVDVEEGQVVWERNVDARPPTLHVAFEYDRQVVYPLLDRTGVKTFEVDLTADLARADWGTAR